MNLDARMIPRALVIRRVLVALVTAVCAGVAGGAEAFAAETTIGHEIRGAGALERLVIEVEGPIAPGTADRVAAILAEPRSRAVRRKLVVLRSEGGAWAEGVALARLFREDHVGTVIPDGARCLSACAIAFLGGALEDPVHGTVAARAMGATSRLGFHAPYLTLRNRMFLITDVERAYTQAVESMLMIFSLADDLEVDTKLLTDLLVSGEDTFEFVDSVGEAGRLGIYVSGIAGPPATPSTEQIRTYCTNAFDWKRGAARPALAPGEARAALSNAPVLRERVAGEDATGAGWMRTILPIAVDARGAYDWCVFETRLDAPQAGRLSPSRAAPPARRHVCRGFVRERRAEAVAARMRDAPAGWRIAERDCTFPTAADPRAARPDPHASAALAFHPATTALADLAREPETR